MRRSEARSVGNTHASVDVLAILANLAGIIGAVLLVTGAADDDQDLSCVGGALVLIYLLEGFVLSTTFRALNTIMSEEELVAYIKNLQEATPEITFTIQNWHSETRQRRVTDRQGVERIETYQQRVNTHSASMDYHIAGHTDETLSPQQMVAMFHLSYDADGNVRQSEVNRGTTLLLMCHFPVNLVPRDEQTEADFPSTRNQFYAANTTDTQQDKSERHTLSGCMHRDYALVVLHTGGVDRHTTPWWMNPCIYCCFTFIFLSVLYRIVFNAKTQRTTWTVTKHFSILDPVQFEKDPKLSLRDGNDKRLAAAMKPAAQRAHELVPCFPGEQPDQACEGDWHYVPPKYPDVKPDSFLPSYWKHKDPSEAFHTKERVPEEIATQIQHLLERTFKGKATRDRQGPMPKHLRLVSAHRIEDQYLWAQYVRQKARIMSLRRACTALCHMEGSGEAKTMSALSQEYQSQLTKGANELYLWHGTSPTGAFGIRERGFKLSLAGSAVGTMFGPGAYFAECCSKSDEYAKCDPSGVFAGVYALLLCRVVCGEMFRITKSDIPEIQIALRTGKYDGVLGDREMVVDTYREFVVFEEAQVYPEYVVLYRREFE